MSFKISNLAALNTRLFPPLQIVSLRFHANCKNRIENVEPGLLILSNKIQEKKNYTQFTLLYRQCEMIWLYKLVWCFRDRIIYESMYVIKNVCLRERMCLWSLSKIYGCFFNRQITSIPLHYAYIDKLIGKGAKLM